MGQKVHPLSFRLGVIKDWNTKWFAQGKEFKEYLHESLKLKEKIKKRYYGAAISKIVVVRDRERVKVEIHCARPGVIIGRRGLELEKVKQIINEMTGKDDVVVNIIEIKRPELDAQLVAESIASQMERRIPHRQAMKRAITAAVRLGAKGIKIMCSGRLGGVELARREWYREGRLPLHTIRADIDYGDAVAKTKWGTNGVKVWIFKGEVLGEGEEEEVEA